MLRSPASLELFTLSADSIKVVSDILYLKGMPPISADNVIGCNLLCPSTGTAKVVRIEPIIADGCDCPFTWDLTAETLPDLLDAGTNNTFNRPLFYNYEAPNGATPTQLAVATEIIAQINADPNAPFTAAAYNTDEIELTGKANGATWNVYAPSANITVATAGTPDELNATTLKQMFPIQVGVFGQSPAALDVWCGENCLLRIKVKFCCEDELPSDAYDISMNRALLGHEYEFVIPISSSYNDVAGTPTPADPTNWDEPYKMLAAFFTCLVAGA